MVKSYSQKADAVFRVLRANPNTSASAIYNRYKNTPLGMRKTDSLELTKLIKAQLALRDEFVKKINNSDMTDSTKRKLVKEANKQAYLYAKNNTKRGKKDNKKNIIFGGVGELDSRTFSRRIPDAAGYYEFY